MKKLLFAIILLISACSEDNEPGSTQTDLGCHRGIDANGDNVFVRCVTQMEYAKGEKGFSDWNDYSAHTWKKCTECQ